MTVESSTSKAVYSGNNSAVDFPFHFKVFEKNHLSISVTNTNVSPNITEQVNIPEADISLQEYGGTIKYLHTQSDNTKVPLPSGYKISIIRSMPFLQEMALVSGQPFLSESLEKSLDIATMALQELREQISRAVILPPTSEQTPEEVITDVFNANAEAKNSAEEAEQSAQEAKDYVDNGLVSIENKRQESLIDLDNKENSSLQNIEDSRASALLEVGTQVDIATTKASEASQSAQEARNSEEEARSWATGTQAERPEGSAKDWADKAKQAVEQENVNVPGTLAFNNLKLGTAGTVMMSAEELEWLNNFSYFGNEQYNMDTTTYTQFNATFANPKAEARYLAFTPAIYQAWKKLSIEENIDWINMTDAEYNTWKNNI